VVDCILRFTGGGETLRSALRLGFVLILQTGEGLRLKTGPVSTRAALLGRLLSMKVQRSRERRYDQSV